MNMNEIINIILIAIGLPPCIAAVIEIYEYINR